MAKAATAAQSSRMPTVSKHIDTTTKMQRNNNKTKSMRPLYVVSYEAGNNAQQQQQQQQQMQIKMKQMEQEQRLLELEQRRLQNKIQKKQIQKEILMASSFTNKSSDSNSCSTKNATDIGGCVMKSNNKYSSSLSKHRQRPGPSPHARLPPTRHVLANPALPVLVPSTPEEIAAYRIVLDHLTMHNGPEDSHPRVPESRRRAAQRGHGYDKYREPKALPGVASNMTTSITTTETPYRDDFSSIEGDSTNIFEETDIDTDTDHVFDTDTTIDGHAYFDACDSNTSFGLGDEDRYATTSYEQTDIDTVGFELSLHPDESTIQASVVHNAHDPYYDPQPRDDDTQDWYAPNANKHPHQLLHVKQPYANDHHHQRAIDAEQQMLLRILNPPRTVMAPPSLEFDDSLQYTTFEQHTTFEGTETDIDGRTFESTFDDDTDRDRTVGGNSSGSTSGSSSSDDAYIDESTISSKSSNDSEDSDDSDNSSVSSYSTNTSYSSFSRMVITRRSKNKKKKKRRGRSASPSKTKKSKKSSSSKKKKGQKLLQLFLTKRSRAGATSNNPNPNANANANANANVVTLDGRRAAVVPFAYEEDCQDENVNTDNSNRHYQGNQQHPVREKKHRHQAGKSKSKKGKSNKGSTNATNKPNSLFAMAPFKKGKQQAKEAAAAAPTEARGRSRGRENKPMSLVTTTDSGLMKDHNHVETCRSLRAETPKIRNTSRSPTHTRTKANNNQSKLPQLPPLPPGSKPVTATGLAGETTDENNKQQHWNMPAMTPTRLLATAMESAAKVTTESMRSARSIFFSDDEESVDDSRECEEEDYDEEETATEFDEDYNDGLINSNVIVHEVPARADNGSTPSMQLTDLVFEMPTPNANDANNKKNNNKNGENGDGDGNPVDPVAVGGEASKTVADSTTKTTSSESTRVTWEQSITDDSREISNSNSRSGGEQPTANIAAAADTATGSRPRGRSITLRRGLGRSTSRSASRGASRDASRSRSASRGRSLSSTIRSTIRNVRNSSRSRSRSRSSSVRRTTPVVDHQPMPLPVIAAGAEYADCDAEEAMDTIQEAEEDAVTVAGALSPRNTESVCMDASVAVEYQTRDQTRDQVVQSIGAAATAALAAASASANANASASASATTTTAPVVHNREVLAIDRDMASLIDAIPSLNVVESNGADSTSGLPPGCSFFASIASVAMVDGPAEVSCKPAAKAKSDSKLASSGKTTTTAAAAANTNTNTSVTQQSPTGGQLVLSSQNNTNRNKERTDDTWTGGWYSYLGGIFSTPDPAAPPRTITIPDAEQRTSPAMDKALSSSSDAEEKKTKTKSKSDDNDIDNRTDNDTDKSRQRGEVERILTEDREPPEPITDKSNHSNNGSKRGLRSIFGRKKKHSARKSRTTGGALSPSEF